MKKDTKNQSTKSPSTIQEYLITEEGQKIKKQIDKLYEDNSHHIKARDILKDAIQAAMNNPAMTPEIKDTADFFILLLDETGNSFKYDADAVIDPVVQIARVEIPSQGGRVRTENAKTTPALKAIEEEAKSNAKNFKRYGYQAEFTRAMLMKYPVLKDDKAMIKRLKKLQEKGLIEKLKKK